MTFPSGDQPGLSSQCSPLVTLTHSCVSGDDPSLNGAIQTRDAALDLVRHANPTIVRGESRVPEVVGRTVKHTPLFARSEIEDENLAGIPSFDEQSHFVSRPAFQEAVAAVHAEFFGHTTRRRHRKDLPFLVPRRHEGDSRAVGRDESADGALRRDKKNFAIGIELPNPESAFVAAKHQTSAIFGHGRPPLKGGRRGHPSCGTDDATLFGVERQAPHIDCLCQTRKDEPRADDGCVRL